MAAVDRIAGDRGQIKIDPLGGGAGVTVGSMNGWNLSLAKEYYKVTCFGDVNQVYTPGLPDISGNLKGMYDLTDRTIFTIAFGTVAPFLTLIPNTLSPASLFKGLAWLDASLDVGQGGAVTTAGTFKAAGPWVMV
jgi:hypothetical protein